jgi:hypothetical protein
MRTEKIGLSEKSEDGKEGFRGTDLVLKKLKRVGKSMTDRPTEGAQPEGVKESFGLVTDPFPAVL